MSTQNTRRFILSDKRYQALSKVRLNYLFATSTLLLSLLQIGKWVSRAGFSTGLTTSTLSSLLPDGYDCKHEYTVELMSFDPLVVYVNSFVSDEEINHILEATFVPMI